MGYCLPIQKANQEIFSNETKMSTRRRGTKRKKHQINEENVTVSAKDSDGNAYKINLGNIRDQSNELHPPSAEDIEQENDFHVNHLENTNPELLTPDSGPSDIQTQFTPNDDQKRKKGDVNFKRSIN